MSEEWTAWPAPAKLNLFLHVIGRREDGYHELETLFQLVDLCDEVRIRVRDDGRTMLPVGAPGVAACDDLVLRAARLLQERTDTKLGADLALDKRIPMGGGLGGGSSDAATVLVALDHLWRTGLDPDALAALGVELGADVPVFVRGHSAFGQGKGERLTPVALGPRWFLVLDPGVAVSTAELFQAPELTRNSPPSTIDRFFAGESSGNAFEPLVRMRHPRVAAALDWLATQGKARLSGTGGCVFAEFEDEARAREGAARCPPQFRAFVVKGVNESPLLAVLRERRAAA